MAQSSEDTLGEGPHTEKPTHFLPPNEPERAGSGATGGFRVLTHLGHPRTEPDRAGVGGGGGGVGLETGFPLREQYCSQRTVVNLETKQTKKKKGLAPLGSTATTATGGDGGRGGRRIAHEWF